MINSLGLDPTDRLSLCYTCKGLSLTDCYWLKSESDTKSNWDTISLYRNSLSNSVAHVALTGEYLTIQGRVYTPELTSGGSFAKCWRRGKNGIYLYKAGSSGGNVLQDVGKFSRLTAPHKVFIVLAEIRSHEGKYSCIDRLMKLADERMYRHKKEIKAKYDEEMR